MKKIIDKIFSYQGLRFLFVGGLNTLVGYGIYALLVFLGVNYLISNTISTIIGVAHSYLWNRFFTFKSKNKALKEITKFVSVYIASYLIGMCTLFIFKDKLNISPYLAGLINLVITTLISYFGHKYISFRKNEINIKQFFKNNINVIIPILLFVLSFIFLCTFKNLNPFTDEADVFLGAKSLSSGKLIYRDFASQHLPFTYLFLAPFEMLGVNSIVGLRICSYILLSLIFTFMYVRYNKTFGKTTLFIYPFFYMIFMSTSFLHSSIVSEQFQTQFLVILLLELLMFYKNKSLSTSSKIIISSGIILSIGCAFVSIISVFLFILALFYIDIKNYITNNKKFRLNEYIKYFFKNYLLIVVIGIVSIVIFLLILLLTNSFSEFIRQAFYLNTEIYSKYNGYSSNPVITIIKLIPNYILSIKAYMNLPIIYKGVSIFVYLGVLLYILTNVKKDFIYTILLFLYILSGGNRAFVDFHALPYFGLAIMTTLLFIRTLNFNYQKIFIFLFSILFLLIFLPNYKEIYKFSTSTSEYNDNLSKLIDSDEMIDIRIDTYLFIQLDKSSAARFAGMVPWFAELYEDEYLKEIKQKKPNIIFYNPYDEVWGYKYVDFVPKINTYIHNNYIYYSDYSCWVRNDYIDETEKITNNSNIAFYDNNYNSNSYISLGDNIIEEKFYLKDDVSAISLKFNTYDRINYCKIKFEIFNEKGNTIFNKEISASELINNSFYNINFNNPLQKNNNYILRISSNMTSADDYVSIFTIEDSLNYDNSYMKINDTTINNTDIIMKYYK